jgi:hypothetical protein
MAWLCVALFLAAAAGAFVLGRLVVTDRSGNRPIGWVCLVVGAWVCFVTGACYFLIFALKGERPPSLDTMLTGLVASLLVVLFYSRRITGTAGPS